MARLEHAVLAFNRGLVSVLGLARLDLKRLALSAQEMTNWMPRALGSMMLRPGFEHLGSTDTGLSRFIPFVRSLEATALIEIAGDVIRVWRNDAVITRAAVSTVVTNGTFDTDLTGWTDADESGGVSAWVTGGYMGLTGNGSAAAIRRQEVTVSVADQNVRHALHIDVFRGPVVLRVGGTSGGDGYIGETVLGTGEHSLSFVPTGNFWVEFQNRLNRLILVDSCEVEASGPMELGNPFNSSAFQALIRGGYPDAQSADVLYLACEGLRPYKIERRGTFSWSIVQYLPEDGPFRIENVGPITINPSAATGNITLVASADLFSADHVGALWSLTSHGQDVTASITVQNTFTNPILITGVEEDRRFALEVTGLTATGSEVTLQRSFDSDVGPWSDYEAYTTNQSKHIDDDLDNQIVWYRIGVKTGDYVAGTIVPRLLISFGNITGVVRITAVSSSLSVEAEVLTALGNDNATDIWAEGAWSDFRGYPTSVALYEARLGWAGKDNVWLSATDAFESFDAETEGDSGPISRSIGSGPVETINWMLPIQRLMLGGQTAEFSCRSNSFDEPLTPTNFNIKKPSSQGSGAVGAISIDSRGMFVQRGGARLFELSFNPETYDYTATDTTLHVPGVGMPGITRMAVQRQPDTRIHCMRSDGTVGVLIYDRAENVLCWCNVETDGDIVDVVVLPGVEGDDEDYVYYEVKRTIDGADVYYLEKWAFESECVGGTVTKLADSFVEFTNSPASVTVSGLDHLEGENVVVWQDGVCPEDADGYAKTYPVSSGAITLDTAATTGIVGLPYEGSWKSAKLGQALNLNRRLDHLSLVLADTHPKGLRYGPTLTDSDMDPLPLMNDGAPVDVDTVYAEFDEPPVEFPGTWDPNSRLCLKAAAPRPVTVCAAIAHGEIYA